MNYKLLLLGPHSIINQDIFIKDNTYDFLCHQTEFITSVSIAETHLILLYLYIKSVVIAPYLLTEITHCAYKCVNGV